MIITGCTDAGPPSMPVASSGAIPELEPTINLTPPPTATTKPSLQELPAAGRTPGGTATRVPTPSQEPQPTPEPTIPPKPETSSAELYARIAPSIAQVRSTHTQGSGILIEGNYVLTNMHVVWPARTVRLTFPDGTRLDRVPVVGVEPMADLALLGPVEFEGNPLQFHEAKDLPVGARVFLIGYPGEVETSPKPTIVDGVLSRIRRWPAPGLTYLQTDAAAAGGQSGGALLDAEGRLLGVSGFKFTAANYALALSSSDIAPIVEKLKRGEPASRLGDRSLPPYSGEFGAEIGLTGRWMTERFAFEAAHGITVRFEPNCDGEGKLRILDTHEEVHQADAGTPQVEITLYRSGLHFLEFQATSDRPLTCELASAVRLQPLNDPDDARILEPGDTVTGNLDYFFDTDWYILELDEGERVRVTADSLNVDTLVHLHCTHCGAGQYAVDDNTAGGLFQSNSQVIYLSPQKGRYFIVVSQTEKAEGGYYLSVEQAHPNAALTEIQTVQAPLGAVATEQMIDDIYDCLKAEGEFGDLFLAKLTEVFVEQGMTEEGARDTALSWLENKEFMVTLIRSAAEKRGGDAQDDWYRDCIEREAPVAAAPGGTLPTVASGSGEASPPKAGRIVHNPDKTTIKTHHAGVTVKDAIISATFKNPYSAQSAQWDYGVYIRDNWRTGSGTFMYLVVTSEGKWLLKWRDRARKITQTIQQSTVDNLNTGPGEENTLWVAALGNRGMFFINDKFVSMLDLSAASQAGDVAVITGVFSGNEQIGAATHYREFRVLPLERTHGTKSQYVDPVRTPGGNHQTEVVARDLVTEARFITDPNSRWQRAFALHEEGKAASHTAGVDHRKMWFHRICDQNGCATQEEGLLPQDTGDEVYLLLFSFGANGLLFVDDRFVAHLDLSDQPNERELRLAVGSYDGDAGRVQMRNFSVWTTE